MFLNPGAGCGRDCCEEGICKRFKVYSCYDAFAPDGYRGFPLPGVLVKLRTGSTSGPVVDSGTTDADGEIVLCMPGEGTYYATVDEGPYTPAFGSAASFIDAGTPEPLEIGTSETRPGYCCFGFYGFDNGCASPVSIMPTTMHLTDSAGTHTATDSCGSWTFESHVPAMCLYYPCDPEPGDDPAPEIRMGTTLVFYTLSVGETVTLSAVWSVAYYYDEEGNETKAYAASDVDGVTVCGDANGSIGQEDSIPATFDCEAMVFGFSLPPMDDGSPGYMPFPGGSVAVSP